MDDKCDKDSSSHLSSRNIIKAIIISPSQFEKFVLPWFLKFSEQGHRHGYQVILHSCGSIHRVIDILIDAGVDCLHPLQAREVKAEVRRLKETLGPYYIVSPSHEAILPDVPPRNVAAMAEAAFE